MKRSTPLLLLFLLYPLLAQDNEGEEFFEARIRPLLSNQCYVCHTEMQSGGLRMDSRESLLKGGTRGPAIIPGNPEESLLIQAVTHTHETLKMPPASKLAAHEVADLVEWIRMGAPWPDKDASPPVQFDDTFEITPEQRAFWSFQPPRKPPLPEVKRKEWVRSPVDYFILGKLEQKGLEPASPADEPTLIRRASYDLLGLPPRPEEIEAFLADHSPDAFARLVDRLLASPHYGERWGRHWLDLVRYSDSAGDSADYPIPQAYLYRDYVIGSFNQDKPYDQFIREQIAGDLLPGRTEKEKWEQVVATGYLALARRFSVRPERNMHLTIEDTIDNLGKTFLGLTVACARCHDHKYDPVSRKDYYALYGIFDSTGYPFAGSENVQEQRELVARLAPSKVDLILKPYREELTPLEEKIETLEKEREAALKGELKDGRTADEIRKEIRDLEKRRKEIFARMPQLETAFAVTEGEPHSARVHMRGERDQLGPEVPRRFLEILGGQELPAWARGSGRLQLAEWLTDPKNSLTARVIVNRIWQYHFGKGLVTTPSDFGKRGAAPSHPELLDYLAVKFIEGGGSIKALHRLIMNSQTYQLSSRGNLQNLEIDPENQYLWQFSRQRLDAESIRDALLMISGRLETGSPGPHAFPHPSDWQFTQHRPFVAVYESKHRSVYLMTQRIQRHPYLSIFDGADPNRSTERRVVTTTPIQALFMMNSEFLHEQADQSARRLESEVPGKVSNRINRAHLMALGRPASEKEIQKARQYLEQAEEKLEKAVTSEPEREHEALVSYLRALLSSNEFIFVD